MDYRLSNSYTALYGSLDVWPAVTETESTNNLWSEEDPSTVDDVNIWGGML